MFVKVAIKYVYTNSENGDASRHLKTSDLMFFHYHDDFKTKHLCCIVFGFFKTPLHVNLTFIFASFSFFPGYGLWKREKEHCIAL